MQDESRHASPGPLLMTEEGYRQLCLIREHVHFMAQLVGTNPGRVESLKPEALTWWITRVAHDVNAILEATTRPTVPGRHDRH